MLIVAPTYPNQFKRQINVGQTKWPLRGPNSTKSYIMEFNIRNVEILHKRDKYNKPCMQGMPDYDDQINQWIMKKVGCKPPYWASISKLPLCSSFVEMKLTRRLITDALFGGLESEPFTDTPPCRSLEKVQYDIRDIDLPETVPSIVTMQFNFREFTYKEIKDIRGMDLQALIGRF